MVRYMVIKLSEGVRNTIENRDDLLARTAICPRYFGAYLTVKEKEYFARFDQRYKERYTPQRITACYEIRKVFPERLEVHVAKVANKVAKDIEKRLRKWYGYEGMTTSEEGWLQRHSECFDS